MMASARGLQLLVITCLASALPARADGHHLLITPESPVLEIGTNFVATCMIMNTTEVTADDLYWTLKNILVPREQYTKINRSALSVTLNITGVDSEWLLCHMKKDLPYVLMNKGIFTHGIFLTKGYLPGKPENLTCQAVQENKAISATLRCKWDSVGSQTEAVPTLNTLNVAGLPSQTYRSEPATGNSAQVTFDRVFPNHMTLEIWVEARNRLGSVQSEHLKEDANFFVKTNPPSDFKIKPENSFPSSLLLNWTRPIPSEYVKLIYQIRFCQNGSHNWTYVPLGDTGKDIQSFRLQGLRPDTVYVTQVCCKNEREGHGYWSDWSTNATKRTPEDRPTNKPDVWRIITNGTNERQVAIICQDPVIANGKIKRFDIRIQNLKDKMKNGSWESVAVNRSDSSSGQRLITVLKEIPLADKDSVRVFVTAVNSAGKSPEASLTISEKRYEGFCGPTPVEELKVWPHEGRLWLQWRPPNTTAVTEYVVQWVSGDETDWQRETRNTRRTAIKGNLQKFVCYKVSVYPIYSGCTGKPAHMEAYLEQGAPEKAPTIRLTGKRGRNEAELEWNEIPEKSRRGFITNYTIFYESGPQDKHEVTVPGNATSYTLKSLSANTQYHAYIRVSTVNGSFTGTRHTFTTLKYAPGEIESIVVGVCLGFLFMVIITMLLCVYKKDAIKENFWPQIPNPGESTIGSWSPDYPLKAETPKENCLSDISVLDVDVCDGKSVFEEDKASLPLKKDKYLSEEHSSGIGGSSCMSSPRQSVSDSDEGGDMADTTASTVQYSSVVASSGYKGQTPSAPPQQAVFSRSESTQPLLDSEENPDMLEGSRQAQRYPRHTHTDMTEQQEALEPLDFFPLEEDSETPTDGVVDWLPGPPASSYMPQLGGYRPQ